MFVCVCVCLRCVCVCVLVCCETRGLQQSSMGRSKNHSGKLSNEKYSGGIELKGRAAEEREFQRQVEAIRLGNKKTAQRLTPLFVINRI